MIKSLVNSFALRLGYEIVRRPGLFGGLNFLAVRPGDVVFDVGGHLGTTTIALRKKFPESIIHVFEPFEAFIPNLENIAKADGNIHIHNLACSDKAGEADLITTGHSLSLTSVHPAVAGNAIETTRVKIETLDSFARKHNIERIALMKVDAEGHDLAVLRGTADLLSRGAVEAVVVEVMFVEIFTGQPLFHEIAAYLAGHGYHLFDLREIKKDETGHYRFANAVFAPPRRRPT